MPFGGTMTSDTFETGTVSFSFTVAPTGRIVDLRLLETQPRELSEFSKIVGRSLRRMIYRPRLQNMELVPTTDGNGRAPVVEVLLNTPLVADHIRNGEVHLLKDLMPQP